MTHLISCEFNMDTKGVRFATINRICYFLKCDVGDILKFDGFLEEEDEE